MYNTLPDSYGGQTFTSDDNNTVVLININDLKKITLLKQESHLVQQTYFLFCFR